MACAIVTAAGTPNRCCAATAPGATRLMNACWSLAPGVVYCRPAELDGAACVGCALGAGAGCEGAGAAFGVAAGVLGVAAGCAACVPGALAAGTAPGMAAAPVAAPVPACAAAPASPGMLGAEPGLVDAPP
jgi:hypothetical protein